MRSCSGCVGRQKYRVAMAILLAIGMSACGSDSSSEDSSESAPAGQTAQATEEFGLSATELAKRIEATEALIGACMADAGFEYVALDSVTVLEAMSSDQTATTVSDEEYVQQYGLGITTQFDKPIVVFGAGAENMSFLASLPEGDQVAFRRTLWGDHPDWNHVRALEQEDFSPTGGCTRSAAEQQYSADELSGSYVNPSDALIEQDPRMIAAIAAWSECMGEEGFQYDTPDQVENDLRDRLEAITQGQDAASLSGASADALAELQGEELAIGGVFVECEEEHIEEVEAQVEAEVFGAPQD